MKSFLMMALVAANVVVHPTPQVLEQSEGSIPMCIPTFNIVGADKGVEPRSGAYNIVIAPDTAYIDGFDDRGVFYGLQTWMQIAKQAGGDSLPLLRVRDWPELERRGVVEGFYGNPWSHEVRLSLIDFYGKNKLNTYIYGPKDDPYHSSPNWRKPYPPEQAARLRELVEASRRNFVDFVWAIHPGKDIRWTEADRDSLVQKFESMYDLGVRSFAIHFDDIEGEGTNPYRQCELVNYLTENFVKKKGDVSPMIVCPTDYSRLWANPTENGASAIYGRTLAPEVQVMYTGDVVCSDLTADTMNWFNALIRRPGYYWWNWPVTDYARNHLLMGPALGLDTTLTRADVAALVSNPMEQGEASKLGLYGVADYAWNPAAYNPEQTWEYALKSMMPECADAFRTFALHNADSETGYRKPESWTVETFRIGEGKASRCWQPLMDEFQRIAAAPEAIRKGCSNAQLLAELEPWLVEFELLGRRGIAVMELIRDYKTISPEEFNSRWQQAYMTAEQRRNYLAHKSGSLHLQPFIDTALDDLAATNQILAPTAN
ncbi:MAG: beta-N-acetylglucosaminidase domain-containing protein [Muribaculaceae bacterium]|nr:beta-N-acetylglucosaminidase domain-containing protein [Muribaculaceae bacterium]